MEESSVTHMETDVSSTTDDALEAPQVSGSHRDIEMVVVVEELKEEDECSLDLALKRTTPSTSTQASPQKQATPIKIIKPFNDNDISNKLSNNSNFSESQKIKSLISVKSSPEKQQPESSASPKQAENNIIPGNSVEKIAHSSPSKTAENETAKTPVKIIDKTVEKNVIKISPIQNVKIPFKDVKLITKSPIKITRIQEKPVLNDVNSLEKFKVVQENPKQASLVRLCNNEINLPEKSISTENTSETLPNKINVTDSSVKESTIFEKSPIKDITPTAMDVDLIEGVESGSNLKNQSIQTHNVQESVAKSSSIESVSISSDLAHNKNNFAPPETKTVNGDVNIDSPLSQNETLTDLNDTLHPMDTEKDHSRSISRELKSLIKSAKESKIISECTQLKSKTRKSRSQLDTSNTTVSTPEPDKVGVRRISNNSQISNSSEKSDNTLKRSMRSQNPEFANKCKQFLNSVTSRVLKDSDEGMSEDEVNHTDRFDRGLKHESLPTSPKKKRINYQPVLDDKGLKRKFRSDGYCWRCHWTVEQEENDKAHPPLHCTVCPRSYHYKCLSTTERKISAEKSWVCPDCLLILQAEGSDTRSPAMKKTSLGTLCDLLKYALERMMDLNGVEPFMQPVDRAAFPDYDKYVVHPMDLSQMQRNIADGLYGSTEAFVADVQWILHNSIIFNTLQSKLTGGARALVRSCRAEMGEIEACPECYAAAHARRATWFTDVCTAPHVLLWAKLKGFPYWPAKGMSVNSSGLVDVRFFGAHDRAWVPAKDCFLFSEKDPNNFRSKRQDILDSMQEAEQHIRNISRKYGKFVYPAFKTQFDPSKLTEQLKMMIPSFDGEIPGTPKEKAVSTSPLGKVKRRSNSKGSKSSANDGDGSESEDASTSSRFDVIKVDKIIEKTEKPSKLDSPVLKASDEPPLTRKRRRSNLDEARAAGDTGQPAPEKKNKPDKPELQEPSSSKEDKAHSATKEPDAENKKKTDTKQKSKDEEPSSTQDERENLRVTPIKLVALPRTNKQTPKMFAATKVPSNPGSPTGESTPHKPKRQEAIKADKTPAEKAKEEKPKKHRTSRSNKSLNNTSTPKVTRNMEKKTENEASGKEIKQKEKKKESDDENKSVVEVANPPRPLKDRLNFDDDTSLAVIARERRRSHANLPTITSVCSLSTTAQAALLTPTATTSRAGCDLTVTAGSSIFVPTSNELVHNMKDAADKLQRLRDYAEPTVGRVGVRAFARMTSPERSKDVEVEIKAEPVDTEEDEVRLSEKMDLMTACKLRPVQAAAHSLRDVRISRVVAGPAPRRPEPRPRARKTFPQPRPAEGRSELNGKNSMVYIPIQPPATQPPARAPRPAPPAPAAHAAHPALRLSAPAPTSASTVSTVITAVKPGSSGAGAPTVGQVPTTVHTVPLMTSVNGQWMFSLQPVMSVGGVDNATSPMVNGAAPAAILPLSASTSNAAAPAQPNRTAADTATPAEMPRLQARPADAAAPPAPPAPPAAGPLSAKVHQHAQKLSELFRSLLEESLDKCEEPAAAAASLRLQLEQARWRHSQEIDELKHNHELTLAEMRLSFEKDKLRVLAEARRAAQLELDAAVKLAKCKQWCANCSQEAQFYCCWNTAYCDLPCQSAHWPQHSAHCAQRNKDGNGNEDSSQESRLQGQPDVLPALQKSGASAALTVGGKIARVFSSQDAAQQKSAIIVSMMEDGSGNQTVKCVGSFKPGAAQPLIINKQVVSDESGKKVVTSGGYLIVGASSSGAVMGPAPAARRANNVYYT